MRKPDNTLIFGSSAPPASVQSPNSVRGPVSLGAPGSRAYEKQWFNQPIDAPPSSIAPPTRPVGHDLLAERRGFIPRSPERGLAFAALALTLIGIAGAGTYFFFGIPDTAHNMNGEVGNTTVTNAEMPAAAPAPEAPVATTTPADLPWAPPVVDAVKAPNLPQRVQGAQQLPAARTDSTPTPNFNAMKTVPTAQQVPANAQQVDDANHVAAGFYPQPVPSDNSVSPTPIQQIPSAGNADVTTRMTPDGTEDNTLRNPSGEPALNQGVKP